MDSFNLAFSVVLSYIVNQKKTEQLHSTVEVGKQEQLAVVKKDMKEKLEVEPKSTQVQRRKNNRAKTEVELPMLPLSHEMACQDPDETHYNTAPRLSSERRSLQLAKEFGRFQSV